MQERQAYFETKNIELALIVKEKERIVFASLAYDNTVVCILTHSQNHNSTHYLKHYALYVPYINLLWEHQLDHMPISFSMLTHREVIIPNSAKNSIDLYLLPSKRIISIEHSFFDNGRFWLATFLETCWLALLENKGDMLRVAYYVFNHQTGSFEPKISKSLTLQHPARLGFAARKLNQHSKIGWWDHSPANCIDLSCFSLQ
jgi:hypothetical protein